MLPSSMDNMPPGHWRGERRTQGRLPRESLLSLAIKSEIHRIPPEEGTLGQDPQEQRCRSSSEHSVGPKASGQTAMRSWGLGRPGTAGCLEDPSGNPESERPGSAVSSRNSL